ncbi:hypothetical protein GF322_02495 [Candidatus Dependentiae bacterium]|nr:hypothetical protein [Candidatus Dependentiae bacterium]
MDAFYIILIIFILIFSLIKPFLNAPTIIFGVIQKVFKNKKLILIVLYFFLITNIFSVSFLKRLTNTFQGPATYILRNSKEIKKQITEPYFWLTNNKSNSLNFSAYHEAGHTLVGYKLGFDIIKTSVFKDKIIPYIYIGETIIDFKSSETNFYKLINTLDEETLKNIICVLLAGGIATEIVYGNDYGITQDNKMINTIGSKLIEKNNNKSLLDKFFYYTKNLSYISKADFLENIKKITKKSYTKTKNLIIENRKTLDQLCEQLKNNPQKTLNESQIKEIIDGKMDNI